MEEFNETLKEIFAISPEIENEYDNNILALTGAKNTLASRPWVNHTANYKVKLYDRGSDGWQERFLEQGYSEEEVERLPGIMPLYELAIHKR